MVESVKPKSYTPGAPLRRYAAKRGDASEDLTVSKKVVCLTGCTVLMELKASPTRPSLFVSCWNCAEIEVAASTACEVAVTAPMAT